MRFLIRIWLCLPAPILLSHLLSAQGVPLAAQSSLWFCLTPALLVAYTMLQNFRQEQRQWRQRRNRLLASEFLLDPRQQPDQEHAAKLKLGPAHWFDREA